MKTGKKATKQSTRLHNRELILKTIYEQGISSRAEIARLTRLTRPTVSELVSLLIDEGIVEEIGLGVSEGGKRPTLIQIVENYKYLIAIDLSSSEFQGCVLNLKGKRIHRIKIPIINYKGEHALEFVYSLINQLIEKSERPILGIGIGTPGFVNTNEGNIISAVNLGWFDIPLKEILTSRFDVPVYIANDSQLAALAEFNYGDKRGEMNNLIVLKVDKGVSAGIVLGGQLLSGDGLGASEIGHVRVEENGKECACGHFGCLETVVSSNAIVASSISLASEHPESIINQKQKYNKKILIGDVIEAYFKNDEYLYEIVEKIGKNLGNAIAYMISSLNIKNVVLAGSVTGFGSDLVEIILREVKERSLPRLSNDVSISLSTLGEDIVIKGATAILLSNVLNVL